MQCGTIGKNVIGSCYGVFACWYIEAMDEVYEFWFVETFEQLRRRVINCVPSHLWDFLFALGWAESQDVGVEYAQTVGILLFAMLAHELHSDADSENWLLK